MKGVYNKFWSVEDVSLLSFLYPNHTNLSIAEFLGKHEPSIIAKAFKLRLKKDKEFMRECSQKTAFKPGHISFNNDKKQSDYMSAEAIEKTKGTRFIKGNRPPNTKETDGAITVRKDCKTGIAYQYIRLSIGKWELLQRYNYKKFIGEIPEGYVVVLKDGNPVNCHPFNLKLISKLENMRRNSIQRFPKELISTIKILSKLKKQIKKNGTE